MPSFDALLKATRPRAYRRDGTPYASLEEWAADYERLRGAGRVVEQTDVWPDMLVSTVWLGLDHSWFGDPPLIFETMVFGGPADMEQDRYSTEAQARAGHALMVRRVRRTRWYLRSWWNWWKAKRRRARA